MKKIITILFAAGSVTFASAQSSQNNSYGRNDKKEARDVILGQNNSNAHNSSNYGNYSNNTRERDEQIQRINREFDQRIAAVRNQRHLKSNEKSKKIHQLEMQRDEQIRQVMMRYSDNRNKDRRDDRNDNHKW